MKILEISSAEGFGGGEVHLVELVRELAGRGHELHVAIREEAALAAKLKGLPVSVHFMPLRNALDLPSAFRLAMLARTDRIDLMHAHVARDYPVAALACRLAQPARLVLTRHHYLPLSHHALYRRLLAAADQWIAVSRSVQETLGRSLGLEPSAIGVIPNWVPDSDPGRSVCRDDTRAALGITAPVVVGMLTSIEPAKGVLEFVEAASTLLDRGIEAEFVIGGSAPALQTDYRKRIESLTARHGAKIRLLGHVENASVFLSALDLVVVASWNEGFSLVTLEAMASGCAVVAPNLGGPAELIEDKISGVLVPPRDADSLRAAIEMLVRDTEMRLRLGETARHTAGERYARSEIVSRYEMLFEEVVKRSV